MRREVIQVIEESCRHCSRNAHDYTAYLCGLKLTARTSSQFTSVIIKLGVMDHIIMLRIDRNWMMLLICNLFWLRLRCSGCSWLAKDCACHGCDSGFAARGCSWCHTAGTISYRTVPYVAYAVLYGSVLYGTGTVVHVRVATYVCMMYVATGSSRDTRHLPNIQDNGCPHSLRRIRIIRRRRVRIASR